MPPAVRCNFRFVLPRPFDPALRGKIHHGRLNVKGILSVSSRFVSPGALISVANEEILSSLNSKFSVDVPDVGLPALGINI
jgi:hypothetical protein